MIHFLFMKQICVKENIDYHIYSLRNLFLISLGLISITTLFMSLYYTDIARYAVIFIILLIIFLNRKTVISVLKGLKKHE